MASSNSKKLVEIAKQTGRYNAKLLTDQVYKLDKEIKALKKELRINSEAQVKLDLLKKSIRYDESSIRSILSLIPKTEKGNLSPNGMRKILKQIEEYLDHEDSFKKK